MRITWLGHATVVLEAGDTRLVTDPVLRRRIAHLRRHAPSADPAGDVDAVLLSHRHHDHLDVPSVRALAAPVFGPPGTARSLRRLPLAVHEVRVGEEHVVDGARVHVVPAVHDGRRWPLGPADDADAVGFVVESGAARVYFAGDTEVFGGMADLGALDVALVPIWGWGPSLGSGHMNPGQATDALALLRPRIAVPIHWGTFLPIGAARRHGHLLRTPVDAFVRHAAERTPDVEVRVLAPGETLEL